MKRQIVDLSHPILQKPSCSFGAVDTAPQLSFEEGEAHGVTFVTSRIDNLHSNTCTHIDFPGHLATLGRKFPKPIGMYPVGRFVGPAAVLDFSKKAALLRPYFDTLGKLTISSRDATGMSAFIDALSDLMITEGELKTALALAQADREKLIGIVIYTGLSEFWRYEKFESWEYIYFYSPFLADTACTLLLEKRLSFIGIDSFQLENPIINFNGHELPLVLNHAARSKVITQLDAIKRFSNHLALLGHDILIYENLRVPTELKNTLIQFHGTPLNMRLEGMNDNALVRPYCFVIE